MNTYESVPQLKKNFVNTAASELGPGVWVLHKLSGKKHFDFCLNHSLFLKMFPYAIYL